MTAFYETARLDGQYTRQGVSSPYTRAYESQALKVRKSVESILGTDISPDQKNVKDELDQILSNNLLNNCKFSNINEKLMQISESN